jgi:photosystem II oxygen-evolving enhancer protein 2
VSLLERMKGGDGAPRGHSHPNPNPNPNPFPIISSIHFFFFFSLVTSFSVDGQDVVYKDIIEPLESVSVSITTTDKATIDDFGPPEEIASTLASKVLTPASQQVKILSVSRRLVDGRPYVDFEFASKASTYIRHALASVSVANGKFYTLTTGANELRRWGKVKGTLESVVASFKVVDRY